MANGRFTAFHYPYCHQSTKNKTIRLTRNFLKKISAFWGKKSEF
jgi:hypothetical protein